MSVRLVTPAGSGGVAVLEVRGADALARVARLAGRRPRLGALALVRLEEAGELVDEALVWAESEQRCEVHLHGSPALVERVRASLAGPHPARPASTAPPGGSQGAAQGDRFWPGEAAWAALPLEEQALAALAQAPGEAAARVLLDQAEGALRRALQELLRLSEGDDEEGRARARELALELVRRAGAARSLWRPPTIVLAGPVNAGKSTLFNALLGEERVLVSEEEGTTRDAVRARATLGSHVFELVDTAGERALAAGGPGGAARDVERAGQHLAATLAAEADLVLRLEPAAGIGSSSRSRPSGRTDRSAARPGEALVLSRADEREPGAPGLPGVPAIDARHDPLGARSAVEELVLRRLGLDPRPWQRGRAVPFTREQTGLVAALAEGPPSGAPRRARLREVLARAPAGGPAGPFAGARGGESAPGGL